MKLKAVLVSWTLAFLFTFVDAAIPLPGSAAVTCDHAICTKLADDINKLRWKGIKGQETVFFNPSTADMFPLFETAVRDLRSSFVGSSKKISSTPNLSVLYYRCDFSDPSSAGVVVGYKQSGNVVTPSVTDSGAVVFPGEAGTYDDCGVSKDLVKIPGPSKCADLYLDPDITVFRHFKKECSHSLATSRAYLFTERDMCNCCRTAIDLDLQDLRASKKIKRNILTILQGESENVLTWNLSGHKKCPQNIC
eukprot:GILI01040928.1.p1 GENE.GILI01040928.1~~GILI01040928.1.p1  ORF type:complete len:250 (+),score=36.33 GILI01040928.1:339-1088(+)